ncbi:uncharacterized protein si:ch73-6k14.2 isoform X1 [Girardinichthys multiradiatus]|uniref:uncharacterized protein si:ch73-6k14.2 isoform X1 n=1 Tax=Girardinichthys multiradiatus TaxID=208333 RepID=UPI001FACD5FC|nr:uncharacterized protein si:ch73-6k14.2 isoform X1 [Girardinichthys multiradiatus]
MKSRCLLSTVDRLPTISELQESNTNNGDPDCSSHTMEEYLDSIKELSQPACYPLHGPLRGHRCWRVRMGSGVTRVPASLFLSTSRSAPHWLPIDPSDVSFTLTGQSSCDPSVRGKQNLLDMLMSQSLFAGLV